MRICSIDPGKTGAICLFVVIDSKLHPSPDFQEEMPTVRIQTKAKREVLDLDGTKKQYYKSGSKKGQVKMKLKSPAKYKMELDVFGIYMLLVELLEKGDHIVIERQNPRPGNSASSSFTTGINYGKLLALAELSKAELFLVTPGVWKKYFGLDLKPKEKKLLTNTEYKQMSISKAFELSGIKTTKDGIADALCIGYHHFETHDNN